MNVSVTIVCVYYGSDVCSDTTRLKLIIALNTSCRSYLGISNKFVVKSQLLLINIGCLLIIDEHQWYTQ